MIAKPFTTAARIVLAFSFFTAGHLLFSQEFSAGINVEDPNPNAVLHLVSPNNDQGILIPKLTTAQRTAMSLGVDDEGLMVYDEEITRFFFWNGSDWRELNVGSTTGIASVASDGTLSGDGTGADPLSVNTGTGPNQIVQLDGAGSLPAVDGSNLMNLNDGDNDATNEIELPATAGTGQVLAFDGTNWVAGNAASGDMTQAVYDANGDNVVDDAELANGFLVERAVPADAVFTDTQLTDADITALGYIKTATVPANSITTTEIADGTIQDVDINDVDFSKLTGVPVNLDTDATDDFDGAFASLTGVPANLDIDATDDITTADVGTGPNQIVQLDGTSRLPAVDGSQLTNIVATSLSGLDTDALTEGTTNLYYTDARADGRIAAASVTDLADVSDAGSGQIITAAERTQLSSSISDLTSFDTDNLTEGTTNLYFTDARADGRIAAASVTDLTDVSDAGSGQIITATERTQLSSSISDLTSFDTDNLTEGTTNLYYTDARADGRIAAASVTDLTDVSDAGSGQIITAAERTQLSSSITDLTSFDTDNLTEGTTNLYFTDARADGRIAAASVTDLTDVSDAGSGQIITAAERTQLATNTTNIASLGTASAEDVGTGIGNVLQFTTAGQLPMLDGSQLINLPAPTLNSANIFVGNGSNVAAPVAMTGDVTIDNTGTTTIANNAVDDAKVSDDITINTADDRFTLFDETNTGNTATIELAGLTAPQTYNLPDVSGTLAIAGTPVTDAEVPDDITINTADDRFTLFDETNTGNTATIELAGLTAPQTYNLPDASGTLAIAGAPVTDAEVPDDITINTADDRFTLFDETNTGNTATIELAGLTAPQTYNLPDASGTLAIAGTPVTDAEVPDDITINTADDRFTLFDETNTGNTATIELAGLTAPQTYNLPDASGTLAIAGTPVTDAEVLDDITINTADDRFTLFDETNTGNTATIELADLTAPQTYNLPDVSGTLLTLPFDGTVTTSGIPAFNLFNDAGDAPAAAFGNNTSTIPQLNVYTDVGGTGAAAGGIGFSGQDDATDIQDVAIIRGEVTNSTAANYAGELVFEVNDGLGFIEAMRILDDGTSLIQSSLGVFQDISFNEASPHFLGVDPSTTGNGGDLTVFAGDDDGANNGGNLLLASGDGFDNGGITTIGAGDASNASGVGGDILLIPGAGGNSTIDGIVSVNSTSALLLPVGADLDRPAGSIAGMIRYNTDSDVIEGYIDDGTPEWEALNTASADLTAVTTNIEFVDGTNREITIADGATIGDDLTINAGTGLGNDGGNLTLNGGGSANLGSSGGDVTINAGGAPGPGASVFINASNGGGAGSANGGSIALQSGTGSGGGDNGGNISLTAGGGTSNGGNVSLSAGGGSNPGSIQLNSETRLLGEINSNLTFSESLDRSITIQTETTGAGSRSLTLKAGGSTFGASIPGGNLNLEGGDGTASGDGGNIILTPGNGGSGTNGIVEVNGDLRIVDGTQAAGFVLTSDAVGNASWQAAGGSFAFPFFEDANTFSVGTDMGELFGAADYQLGVAADGGKSFLTSHSYGGVPEVRLSRANGSQGGETQVQATDVTGELVFTGFATGGTYPIAATIQAVATDNYTPASYGTDIIFSSTRSTTNTLSEAFRISGGETYFSGDVGMGGVTAPQGPLDVDMGLSNVYFTATSGSGNSSFGLVQIAQNDNVNGDASVRFSTDASGSPSYALFGIDQSDANTFKIGRGSILTDGAAELAITTSGNVGIGTNAPTTKLDVNGEFRTNRLSSTTTVISAPPTVSGVSPPSRVIRFTGTFGISAGWYDNAIQEGEEMILINDTGGSFPINEAGNVMVDGAGGTYLIQPQRAVKIIFSAGIWRILG